MTEPLLQTQIGFPYDLERIIDDWVLMGFLVGNDFIPHLPNLHINHDALPLLYRTYISVLPQLGGEALNALPDPNPDAYPDPSRNADPKPNPDPAYPDPAYLDPSPDPDPYADPDPDPSLLLLNMKLYTELQTNLKGIAPNLFPTMSQTLSR
jgi:hypothetical protein